MSRASSLIRLGVRRKNDDDEMQQKPGDSNATRNNRD